MTLDIPVIETERLVLRGPKIEDFEPLCAYFQDPRSAWNGGPLQPFEAWSVLCRNLGQWQLRGHGIWHITEKGDDTYIGFVGIYHPSDWPEPELGYGIMADHEGKGIAFEAACAARTAVAQHMRLTNVPSYIAPENTRSQALALRMGADREADITLRGRTAYVYRHPKQEAA